MAENNISVTVKLYAGLREYGPKKSVINLPKNEPIRSILDRYNIPEEKRRIIILVNGKPHIKQNFIPKNGDIIALFPPIGGG
ncbi:MAG: MoaD/ThiS family protein [Promethearchaeota archaeon]